MVGLAGVVVEVFVAGLMTYVWVNTGQGTLHSIAFNMMIIASVSTLIFNLNPLLRFDGYYILSDLVGIPNLSQRAMRQLRFWSERYLYGLKQVESPAETRREGVWLGVFGVSSAVYRVFVFGGILLLVADRFLLIGIVMALICAVAWVAVPLGRLLVYLASSPVLERNRTRAVAVTASLAVCLLLFLQFVPLPYHFRAPGIVRSQDWTQLHSLTAGYLARLATAPGAFVRRGEPLVEMANAELDLELAAARAGKAEVEARLRAALREALPNLKPLRSLLDSAEKRIQQLEAGPGNPDLASRTRWVVGVPARGGNGGTLAAQRDRARPPRQPRRLSVLRRGGPGGSGIGCSRGRLLGLKSGCAVKAAKSLRSNRVWVVPAEQRTLPSPALGWQAGGPVLVAASDPNGQQAAEPFFEVRGKIVDPAPATLLHGGRAPSVSTCPASRCCRGGPVPCANCCNAATSFSRDPDLRLPTHRVAPTRAPAEGA